MSTSKPQAQPPPYVSASPEAQNALFEAEKDRLSQDVPEHLRRATFRLSFPPSYIVVGVYRLCTDRLLFVPAWDKCKHGIARGSLVGLVWTFLTYGIQKKFIEWFLYNSPRVTGLSDDAVSGYKVPFSVHTYAAILLVGGQCSFILRFFLSRNLRIARDRVWAQTVASRAAQNHSRDPKEFFGPYVEEWEHPPVIKDTWQRKLTNRYLSGWFGRMVVRPLIMIPFSFFPFVGTVISASLKALGTGQYLHRRYYEAKAMTPTEVDVFVEERKWEYRTFGFAAALLEGLPFIGPFFNVSNSVGAAMWAYDLEKKQHFVRAQKAGKGK